MDAAAVDAQTPRIVADPYIGGRRVAGAGGKAVAVHNPFDNSEICSVTPASTNQVDAAVEAADKAFRAPSWKALTGRERGVLLNRLAALLRRDLEAFAVIESMDTGIPIRETRMEVATSAMHLEYFGGLAGSIEGTYQDLGSRFNYTRREPFGVVGQIVPWNTPLKLMARGFAAAVDFLTALVPAAVLLSRHGSSARKMGVPLVPFLAFGALVALFFGDAILDAYLGLF